MKPILLVLVVLLHQASSFIVAPSLSPRTHHHHHHHKSQHCLAVPSNRPQQVSSTALHVTPFIRSVVVAAAAAVAVKSIKIVSQGDVAIVERLGKFQKCLDPGLHFIIPIVDRLRITLSQREQVFDIPPQDCISKDNAPLAADAVVYWRVMDPNKAFYSVMNLNLAIQNLVLTQLRAEIGKLTLDETFSAREQINSVLLRDLDIATEPWGIKITRVEVRDIIPNREILGAMEQQMAAERTKRAVVIKSEGELARAVNEAEGAAQSRVIDAKASAEAVRLQAQAKKEKLELEAQGAAQAIEALVEAVGGDPAEATKFQLVREYIESQKALAVSENAKVILSPDPFNGAMIQALSLYDVAANKEK
mmetsp:Transcript_38261/g.92567  ORF Transcript_38261/g.92567 Transcript_38261/m.92567 type:complete len:363 (+) Transcript_38261:320-1408(+)|eukprot:CAMPEP_0113622810 /NCGR_PEP_ID=MMETSP0017_2-20120614/11707_1 /TAXON_ID=2856 /ORGANISM="Cylindrotheca closterium" /LENGTH=362 /DNA_ID=CAMNT_0000532687 /DNA_START=279 /DNA_END=1367 /DNA_ORIENTATION=- /assembly_acc=CAM_ASM_000147